MNSHEVFIHIHQGCFAGTGAIVRLPQWQWSKPDGYGKISQCITTTKHSKAKTVCIFLGIYCKCFTQIPKNWWYNHMIANHNNILCIFYGTCTMDFFTRYVKLWVAHAPGMPGTFSPPPTSKLAIHACITARASRTCCDACRDRLPAVTGKTFLVHAQPVSGKRPMHMYKLDMAKNSTGCSQWSLPTMITCKHALNIHRNPVDAAKFL